MSNVITKKVPFGRIIDGRTNPTNLSKDAKPREWQYHATKGWRSYRRNKA